jgi:hypothetical protein
MGIAMIALPLPKFAAEGLLHGVTIQSADDIRDAAESQDVAGIAAESLVFAGVQRSGAHYRTENDDACLLIPVAPMAHDIAIYSVAITPLGSSPK